VAKRKDTSSLKLVTAEAQDVEKRFRELYLKANKHLPSGAVGPATIAAGEALQKLLRDHPTEKLWERIPGPLSVAREFALENSPGVTPGVRVCWSDRLKSMGEDLAGENPSEIESLLAQHAALCWLRLAEAELQYTSKLSGSSTFAAGVFYAKLLTAAQRRFTRSIETLARTRALLARAAAAREAVERARGGVPARQAG
jgi:hypothetical protein